ncbi:MAG TPA: CHASE2 domain-containing protein, partial [Gammaproteobacteria bacterium]|nr:CHASE2 domain-containing protein [Gammaproteobacteria bacterium]
MKKSKINIYSGIVVIGLVIAVRLIGGLQFFEFMALDFLLRIAPEEKPDEHIVIIGITEEDLKKQNTYFVTDEEIAKLLNYLNQYEPAIIGLDIYRDVPFGSKRAELVKAFNLKNKNNESIVIGVDKFAEKIEQKCQGDIAAAPELPDDQVGFTNLPLDMDGNTRRAILASIDECTKDKKLRFSLAIRLAEKYLNGKGYELNNDPHDDREIVFTSKNSNKIVKLPRFASFPEFNLEQEEEIKENHHRKLGNILATYGGYIRPNDGLNQILLSARRHKNPYRTFSLSAIKLGEVKKKDIQGRIVLIAMTSESHKDFFN